MPPLTQVLLISQSPHSTLLPTRNFHGGGRACVVLQSPHSLAGPATFPRRSCLLLDWTKVTPLVSAAELPSHPPDPPQPSCQGRELVASLLPAEQRPTQSRVKFLFPAWGPMYQMVPFSTTSSRAATPFIAIHSSVSVPGKHVFQME